MKPTKPVKAWSARIIRQVRYRAKKYSIPFNIDSEYLLSKWTGRCPVLHIPLRFHSSPQPDSPSLDRLIGPLGYTKGNVEIISMRANEMKGDAAPWELRRVADWVEHKCGKRGDTR